jgi:hypothetical protein
MMKPAIETFDECMLRARALHDIHGAISKQVTSAIDLSDILRAEIVLCLSALDHFVHELTRLGMLECWEGTRALSKAFGRFPLPVAVASKLGNPAVAKAAFESEIRAKHSFLSFQHPDKIADAVRLVSDKKLWEEVATELGAASDTLKTSLRLMVDRRNKIAHEADIDPSYPGQRWPIDRALVEEIFREVEKIARAIYKVVS